MVRHRPNIWKAAATGATTRGVDTSALFCCGVPVYSKNCTRYHSATFSPRCNQLQPNKQYRNLDVAAGHMSSTVLAGYSCQSARNRR